MSDIFIGTSGYTYKDWKEKFYPSSVPQSQWLPYYSHQFQTVEINATFYGTFTEEQIKHWYEQTPKDFVFSIKASRFLTHVRRLVVTEEDIARFFGQLFPLKEKLSCVLWQLPGNFRLTKENFKRLEAFLVLLPRDVRHAIEFRDSSWFVEELWKLLQQYNVAFVISQTSEFPSAEIVTANFVYIRFHGPRKLYASKYADEALQNWARKVQNFAKKYDVYCYFNNDFEAYAIQNAKQLAYFLNKKTYQHIPVQHP